MFFVHAVITITVFMCDVQCPLVFFTLILFPPFWNLTNKCLTGCIHSHHAVDHFQLGN